MSPVLRGAVLAGAAGALLGAIIGLLGPVPGMLLSGVLASVVGALLVPEEGPP